MAANTNTYVYDVSEADFNPLVVEKSFEVPVLLDFWAPWCGPCKTLGPMLEKLAAEYQGAFVVARINADEAQQLAAYFQIKSIPHCMLIREGRKVDQFSGALTEGQLRSFFDRHLVSEGEQLRRQAAELTGQEREALLREAQAMDPGNPAIVMDLAEHLLDQGQLEDVQILLDILPPEQQDARYRGLSGRLLFAKTPPPPGDLEAFMARVADNPKDFEARFGAAELLVHRGEFDAGFEQLLEVVLRDRGEGAGAQRERARLRLIELFGLSPDPRAVAHARRMLGMYLN